MEVGMHIVLPNLRRFPVHVNVLVAASLPRSLLRTAVKEESHFCGYNFKRVQRSDAARRFETLRLKNPFLALFKTTQKKPLLVQITYSKTATNSYNNFVVVYHLDPHSQSLLSLTSSGD